MDSAVHADIPTRMNAAPSNPTLPWTGERMVPHASDAATELFHWQRYLYFTPWYRDARVADAASGEGYGTAFAGVYAQSVVGIDLSDEAVRYAQERYRHASFQTGDVVERDYSEFDLVLSFETIEHLPDPEAFLKALATCPGRIVISTPNRKTHSPGNQLADKPYNPFHTIEWTPSEFADLIQRHFSERQVRFLSQEARFPGLIREGLDNEAMYCIAVIGEGDLPSWPRLGLAIPTCNNFAQLQETVLGLCRYYPGEIEMAIVANGTSGEHLDNLRMLQAAIPYIVHLVVNEKNEGYGRGCNRGLDTLWSESWCDYFGVINDDVVPSVACTIEMVQAFRELEQLGHRPGLIGPVSNNISGKQQVHIGAFANKPEMMRQAEAWHRNHHSGGTAVVQLRGLYLLIHPDCLSEVGGFDPRFGIGNFEDDDFNLRCRLAGFTLWIADGAFLYHHGSQTFKNLNVDYAANMERNEQVFRWKWDLVKLEDWPLIDELPDEVELFVPLSARYEPEFAVNFNGEVIDLVHQVSDMEFVAWVFERLKVRPRTFRREIIRTVLANRAEPAKLEVCPTATGSTPTR